MKQQHAHTLEELFHHPLKHDLRMSDVASLLLHLGAHIENLSDHRLKLQLTSGETMVLHAAGGGHRPFLDADGMLRLRRFLEQAGITPNHPDVPSPHPRGDQAKRLVIHFDHHGARLWWLEGDTVDTYTLQAHGIWGSRQRLSHRHDRDVAGQRAPVDYDYLNQLSEAVVQADRVLLLGHGHGQSDLRDRLKERIKKHHPEAEERLEVVMLDDTACSDAELLDVARARFGNSPHRRIMQAPGQEIKELGLSS
jgi:hypothetical protein